ncbi:hypothetical protein GGR50DRAFT_692861 [Xylaria sp. CBS 124048]|nr:hypothetical protein GGR50DRAFT_692861 [Xylaria sp. CBS 124048]
MVRIIKFNTRPRSFANDEPESPPLPPSPPNGEGSQLSPSIELDDNDNDDDDDDNEANISCTYLRVGNALEGLVAATKYQKPVWDPKHETVVATISHPALANRSIDIPLRRVVPSGKNHTHMMHHGAIFGEKNLDLEEFAIEVNYFNRLKTRLLDKHNRYWEKGVWRRSGTYRNVLLADTLDVAMHLHTRRSYEDLSEDDLLLTASLELLEICQLLREPWNKDCGPKSTPVPSLLSRQLNISVSIGLVKPLKRHIQILMTRIYHRDEDFGWYSFHLFLATFVLLHNVDLTITYYLNSSNASRSSAENVESLEKEANNLLHCFHGLCELHPSIVPSFASMREAQAPFLDAQEMNYLSQVVKFVERPGVQIDLRNSRKEKIYGDDRSYWAIQLFESNWEPTLFSPPRRGRKAVRFA